MKKLLLLSIYLLFFANHAICQLSINTVQETSINDSKYSAITIYHSSSVLYHFQSSGNSFYVKKINALNFASILNGSYRLNVPINGIINGGFEDPEGNIILYGVLKILNSDAFVLKINSSNLTVTQMKIIDNSTLIDGCWGEKNSNLSSQSRNYAFLTENGKIFICDAFLNFNTNQYGVDNGIITDISWNGITDKFMATGYTSTFGDNDCFFISFDCKDSYSSGWFVHNKNLYNLDDFINRGKVVHSLLNDGRILIAQIGEKYNYSFTPIMRVSLHTISMTAPYSSVVNSYKSIPFHDYGVFYDNNMIYNSSNGNITLNSKFIYNNIKREYFTNITVNSNIISFDFKFLTNQDINIWNLTYNPIDQIGALPIATGLSSNNQIGYMVFIHNVNNNTCDQITLLNKAVTLNPAILTVTDSYSQMPIVSSITLPQFNVINSFSLQGDCGHYHVGLPPPSKKTNFNDLNSEINISLFESSEFMLQGFKDDVFCKIYDMTGKLVYNVVSKNDENNTIPQLSNGIYILKAQDNYGNDKSIKFFKN